MLENGDSLDVDISHSHIQVDISGVSDSVEALLKGGNNTGKKDKPAPGSTCFLSNPVPTPYAINLANVEYVKGGMNPQTNAYGLKIFFCSGHELWIEGEAAAKFLELMQGESKESDGGKKLHEKFRAKMG